MARVVKDLTDRERDMMTRSDRQARRAATDGSTRLLIAIARYHARRNRITHRLERN